YQQDDLDDSNDEPPKISVYEALNGLNTFILFAEQMDNNFFSNINDLTVFQKYISLMKRKIPESMKQNSIVDFFKIDSQTMPPNDKYSLNKMNFSYNNRFSGDDYDFSSDDFPNDDFLDDNFLDNNFPCNDDFSDDDNFSGFPDNYNSSDDYEN
ncbi:10081_t:CDS:1, partial [Cetraspora pellucida]